MLHLEQGLELSPEQSMVLAVDTPDLNEADRLAGIAKDAGLVIIKEGLELLYVANPGVLSDIASSNEMDWIADFKTRATTKTMAPAIRSIVDLDYPPVGITVSTDSGWESLRLAQDIANEKDIMIFGVGHLSTIDEIETLKYSRVTSKSIMRSESTKGSDAGIRGFVTSGEELATLKRFRLTQNLYTLVVGTRSEGVVIDGDDQKRVISQFEAVLRGADLIEVGREVTDSHNPSDAFSRIAVQIRSGREAA